MDELQKRMKVLEKKSVESERRLSELSDCHQELLVCQRNLLSCQAELSNCRSELSTCKKELTSRKGHLAFSQKQLDESKEKVNEMEQTLVKNQLRIMELEKGQHLTAQVDSMLKKSLASQDLRIGSLQQEINHVRETTERLDRLQRLFNCSILNSKRPSAKNIDATQSDGDEPSPETQAQLTVASGIPHWADDGCDMIKCLGDWFYVTLSHHSPSKVFAQLIDISRIYEPSTPFDRRSAKFKARCSGLYGFYVKFMQRGDGELEVWVHGASGAFFSEHIGTTTSWGSTDSKTFVRFMDEGQDCWVEAKAEAGTPGVWSCNFTGFLLSLSSD